MIKKPRWLKKSTVPKAVPSRFRGGLSSGAGAESIIFVFGVFTNRPAALSFVVDAYRCLFDRLTARSEKCDIIGEGQVRDPAVTGPVFVQQPVHCIVKQSGEQIA